MKWLRNSSVWSNKPLNEISRVFIEISYESKSFMVISRLEAVKLDRKSMHKNNTKNSAALTLSPKAHLLKLLSHWQLFVRNEREAIRGQTKPSI